MQTLMTYLLLTFQTQHPAYSGSPDPHALELQTRVLREQAMNEKFLREQQEARDAAVRDYFFAEKFNRFVTKLHAFIDDYNTGKVDQKRVMAVQKAWKDLQKTDGWFKQALEREKARSGSAGQGFASSQVKQ